MKNLLRVLMLLTMSLLPACMGTDEATGDESSVEELPAERSQALPINACSLVRCRAGTQCEIQQGRPVCVPQPKLECASDKECRLFSNYCEGCQCMALSIYETNPVCNGDIVACFVDPCRGAEAQCVKGQCVLSGPVAF
jgi:hypothetical protein